MMKSDDNQDNTRSIDYTVRVTSTDMSGNRHPDFSFSELVPKNVLGPSPAEMPTKQVLAHLSTKHHDEIMANQKWQCWNCEKPAVSMLHNPMSFLHQPKPMVVDLALGICENRGRCDMEGREFFRHEMELAQRELGTAR